MRVVTLLAAMAVSACGAPAGPAGASSAGYEVDAAGAFAVVAESWTLRDPAGGPVGIVGAAARCGRVIYLFDSHGRGFALDVADGRVRTFHVGRLLPFAAAPDCGRSRIALLGPRPRPDGGLGLALLSTASLQVSPVTSVDAIFLPNGPGVVSGGDAYFGGLWMPSSAYGMAYEPPPAEDYYRDKRLGLRVDLATGATVPVFDAYDAACRGAGACARPSIERIETGREAWIVTQPVSRRVGIYDHDGVFVRAIGVDSRRFIDDGTRLLADASAEPMLSWWSRNTTLQRSYLFANGVLATIYANAALPAEWAFGQFVQFAVGMNLHDLDGRALVSDISLPELPVCHDDTSLFVVDYGPGGRQGETDAVRVLRIPVVAGEAGFAR